MAPIHSTDSLVFVCSGCMDTYTVARQATSEEIDLAEAWIETHGRCVARPGFVGDHMVRPQAQGTAQIRDEFRREIEATLTKTAAQLPALAAMLDGKGIAGADIVREQHSAMVALLATLKAHRSPI